MLLFLFVEIPVVAQQQLLDQLLQQLLEGLVQLASEPPVVDRVSQRL